jgi:hypothetical protein
MRETGQSDQKASKFKEAVAKATSQDRGGIDRQERIKARAKPPVAAEEKKEVEMTLNYEKIKWPNQPNTVLHKR